MKHRVLADFGSTLEELRPRGLALCVDRLSGKTRARVQRTDKEKPPRRNPGGQNGPNRWASALHSIAALLILGLGGRHRQSHLLAQGTGHKAPDRVRLPAGGFHELLQGGAAGALQQVEDLGGLAALAGACCLLGRLGRHCAFGGLLRRVGLVARPGLGRRNVSLLCGDPRLFGALWRLSRGTGLYVGGFCWDAVHIAFCSFSGDYRDHIDHSGSPELQANSDGNSHGRRIGEGGEFGSQFGAGGGKC
jgi:hypothetical protein